MKIYIAYIIEKYTPYEKSDSDYIFIVFINYLFIIIYLLYIRFVLNYSFFTIAFFTKT